MSTKTVVFFVLCFILGIVFRSFIDLGIYFSIFLLLLSGLLLLSPRPHAPLSCGSFFVTLLIIAIGCGSLRIDLTQADVSRHVLDNNIGNTIILEGVIGSEPDERDSVTRLVIDVQGIRVHETLHMTKTRVLVTVPLYPTWQYGDRVVLDGVLEKPENFETDMGRTFDYIGYLAKEGVYYQMFRPKMTLIGSGGGSVVIRKLFDIKHAFLKNVSYVLPEPYAALLGGLVVGAKQSLGEKLLDDFRTVGLIHVVVLSGYNVTIIAIVLMKLLSFLPRSVKVLAGCVSIVLFALMTGGGSTIIRASIMAILVVFGRTYGKNIDILRLLFIAIFFMVLHNPAIVLHDPSFQLSVMATLGLVLLAPLFERRLIFIPEKFGMREIVVATISTQLFVLPILMYMTGEVSVISLITNLLILPLIPITMLLGFFTGVAGFFSTTLSTVFGWCAFVFLYYDIGLVELCARIPFAKISVPYVSLFLMFCMYGALFFFIWKTKKPEMEDMADALAEG